MSRGRLFCIALTLATCTISVDAQSGPRRQVTAGAFDTGFRLRVDAESIYLNASVWDPKKRSTVNGLGKDDFKLWDDGVLQAVDACLTGEHPFTVALLLDVSASTAGYIRPIREAAIRFSNELKPRDRLALFTFSNRLTLVQPFTNDRGRIRQMAKRIHPEANTALYDAILSVVKLMSNQEGRKAIVILSDGADNSLVDSRQGSNATFSEVHRAVRTSDCLIYTVFLTPLDTRGAMREINRRAEEHMRQVSAETGARMFTLKRPTDLSTTYAEIASDLRQVYTLSFRPTDSEKPGWRPIEIEVNQRPELIISCRRGYFSTRRSTAE